MLDRNRRIKNKPERFQSSEDHFDIIVTCEERVYDQVIEGMLQLCHQTTISVTFLSGANLEL